MVKREIFHKRRENEELGKDLMTIEDSAELCSPPPLPANGVGKGRKKDKRLMEFTRLARVLSQEQRIAAIDKPLSFQLTINESQIHQQEQHN